MSVETELYKKLVPPFAVVASFFGGAAVTGAGIVAFLENPLTEASVDECADSYSSGRNAHFDGISEEKIERDFPECEGIWQAMDEGIQPKTRDMPKGVDLQEEVAPEARAELIRRVLLSGAGGVAVSAVVGAGTFILNWRRKSNN